ncbi:glycosyltransferase [Pengzhenrongella phosphoraccumulans]|uniref:glycosyltransferase n=1 Tax=Pengzhenrongella phosphoraccumulans TaxID=3114394 RepID=UPI00388EEF4A
MADVVASVVIPARDAAATIGEQLAGLATQDTDVAWEVIVVDNGSSDATVAIAQSYADRLPRLTVTTCERPGANAARNAGAGAAAGELLLYCDADDVVAPGWVSAMVEALATDDVVGGLIDNDSLGTGAMERHPPGVPVVAGFLPRAITANLGVRRAAWEHIGGFAEDYEYGCTDTEFCWRLQLAGYTIGYAERAVVAYRHRGTLRSAARKAFLTGRARGRLFRDFHPRGMPQPRLAGVALRWVRIVAATPLVPFSRRARWWWAVQGAGAAGRVAGSRKFHVRYL